MKREDIYQRLRDIGCTVETADAMAEVLESESDKDIQIIFDWSIATPRLNICKDYNISKNYLKKLTNKIKKAIHRGFYSEKVSNGVEDE